MDQIVSYVTCFAAVGLFFATCGLVWVTIHHAHSAEKMAAATDRLGEILDRQAVALADVVELHALVSALAARHVNLAGRGPHFDTLELIIKKLYDPVMAKADRRH
jgi:hypothetical protein